MNFSYIVLEMGRLMNRRSGKFYMCCNRAFLTEDAYQQHVEEKKDHGKPLDFTKIMSKVKYENSQGVDKAKLTFDKENRKLWAVRKTGCSMDANSKISFNEKKSKNRYKMAFANFASINLFRDTTQCYNVCCILI